MTEGLVRQFTDFSSLEAYLDGYAVTGRRLETLRFPATILLAEDDPIIPASDLERLAPSPLLTVLRTSCGGHCGFMERLHGFVVRQFQQFAQAVSASSAADPAARGADAAV